MLCSARSWLGRSFDYCSVVKMKQVCVVGAGTAGLCSARQVLDEGQGNWAVTVFEQTDKIGGTWVYTDRIGLDEYGLEVHSSMYQGLRTNLPKEVMGYPDFPIDESHPESYVPSAVIEQFLLDYATKHQLRPHIKFLHYVVRISPKRNGQWQVIVRDLKSNELQFHVFDYVMICNGHYHTPSYPNIPNIGNFRGTQLHSHDYKNSDRFKDESVLIIGAGPSGMDLCHEISRVAKRVTLSHHMAETPQTQFRPNVDQKPDVKTINPDGRIQFTDDSIEHYNVIFYCTGFRYAFPFLSVDCGVYVEENCVQPLYKHCLNIEGPTMAFIGIPFYVCAAQMCDLQARFALQYWSGRKAMPHRQQMLDDMRREMDGRLKRGLKKRQAHMMGENQGIYYDDLASTANIQGIKPVMTALHNESSRRFLDDLLHFREDVFRLLDDENFIKIN